MEARAPKERWCHHRGFIVGGGVVRGHGLFCEGPQDVVISLEPGTHQARQFSARRTSCLEPTRAESLSRADTRSGSCKKNASNCESEVASGAVRDWLRAGSGTHEGAQCAPWSRPRNTCTRTTASARARTAACTCQSRHCVHADSTARPGSENHSAAWARLQLGS